MGADLRRQTLASTKAIFRAYGHNPSQSIWAALEDLIDALVRMAEGKARPLYYLSSLDPGLGKTTVVVQFLKSLVSSEEHRAIGALVGVSRLDEVRSYVEGAALDTSQFAVLTSSEELNALGSGRPRASQVLFTTQQMIERRTRNNAFSDVDVFLFKGNPRQVRVWDETLDPAMPLTVRRDDLGALIGQYRPVVPGLADDLDVLVGLLKDAKDGDTADIPDVFSDHGLDETSVLTRIPKASDALLQAARTLWLMSGKSVGIRKDGRYGTSLVDYHEHLPEDLPPIVILDASGRVRTTYRWWEEHRQNLVRLKEAAKNYSNLTLHLWERGGGKSSFEEYGPELLQGIALTIDQKPTEDWLIVHHKEVSKLNIPEALKALTHVAPERLHFITWGNHHATNLYADIRNVILAGTLFYRPSLNEAIGRAAARIPPRQRPLTDWELREVLRGEQHHLILQALCRGAVRKSQGDTCGPCDAYLIAKGGFGDTLEQVFPGARIVRWRPLGLKLTGKVKEAADFILDWFTNEGGPNLPFKTVREHLNMNAPNFLQHIRQHSDFQEFLWSHGLVERGNGKQARYFQRRFDDASHELQEGETPFIGQEWLKKQEPEMAMEGDELATEA